MLPHCCYATCRVPLVCFSTQLSVFPAKTARHVAQLQSGVVPPHSKKIVLQNAGLHPSNFIFREKSLALPPHFSL
jgi:hypothetical protein